MGSYWRKLLGEDLVGVPLLQGAGGLPRRCLAYEGWLGMMGPADRQVRRDVPRLEVPVFWLSRRGPSTRDWDAGTGPCSRRPLQEGQVLHPLPRLPLPLGGGFPALPCPLAWTVPAFKSLLNLDSVF